MKKAVLILAALLLVSSFAIAQDAGIKIGAWGRGLYVAAMGGEDVTSVAMASWGPYGIRVGMTISGTSPNVGFQVDFNGDNNGEGQLNLGDQQKIWVKPIDMLTLQVGRIYDDTLRGNAGAFGAWNWVRYDVMTGEDVVFGRLGVKGQRNFAFSLAPIEGLYIFGGINGIMNAPGLVEDVVKLGQYGAGYTIPNIGVARVQYIGDTVDLGYINAAFKLTAVQNLTVDVGASFATDADEATAGMKPQIQIGIGAGYTMDALSINAMGNIKMPTSDESDLLDLLDISTISIEAGLGVGYSLGGGLAVEGDFRYANDLAGGINMSTGEAIYPDGVIGAMAGITMGFSNGLIGAGIEVTTGNFAGGLITKADASDLVWALPIRFEYWF